MLVDLEPPWVDQQYGSWCYGPPGIPEVTLGRGLIKWGAAALTQPDGRNAGQPWLPVREQTRFILNFFALEPGWTPYTPCDEDCDPAGCDPEHDHARWIYHRGVLRRMKGAGKDPLAAWLCFAHLFGDVVPVWDDKLGRWVGERHQSPLVQIAAVAQYQTRNTGLLFNGMLPERTRARYQIDVQATVVTVSNGRLEAITSSPLAAEGPRVSFGVINEPQNWKAANGGILMADVMRRNTAKVGGRTLEIGNAHQPGEESVSEATEQAYNAWRSGKLRENPRILFDNRTAPPESRLDDPQLLRAGLIAARGDSHWVRLVNVRTAMAATDSTPAQARRFYLNLTNAADDAWTTEPQWNACADPGVIPDGSDVVVFGDLSKSRDATALIAVAINTGRVQTLNIWQRPHGAHRAKSDPLGDGFVVPRLEVYRAAAAAVARWNVVACWMDPSSGEDDEGKAYWGATMDNVAKLLVGRGIMPAVATGPFAHKVRWDMRDPNHTKVFTMSAERTLTDIEDGSLIHDGHPLLSAHVLSSRRRPNKWGISIGKEHSDSVHLVDGGVTMVAARMMRLIYIEWAASRRHKRAGTVAGVRTAS